jgi:hypothetical protein
MRESSQRLFRALDMDRAAPDLRSGEDAAMAELELTEAEGDPRFSLVASTWDSANDRLVAGISSPGLRFIDLANILKHDALPFAKLVDLVLDIGTRSLGSPVEIEYALNLDEESGKPALYILQLKPLIRSDKGIDVDLSEMGDLDCFIRSERSMGNGRVDDITDVVWVDPARFDRSRTRELATEIEALDRRLREAGRRYLLIGFGRWGTRDPWLGVPVAYSQIAQARVIVEADLVDFRVESSLGSHFFHNVTSMNIGYITVPYSGGGSTVDWDWLAAQPRAMESAHCVWTLLEEPLDVIMDGKNSRSAIFKRRREVLRPEPEPELDSIE